MVAVDRRRRFLPEFSQQSLGPTLGENQPFKIDAAQIDPFPTRGSDAQTVSVLQGARYLAAPSEGGLLEFPEHAPIAAFDGDLSTMWVADRYLLPDTRWIEIGFNKPRNVPYVDLVPVRDPQGIETAVSINGVSAKIGPGLNRIAVHLKNVSALRVTITHVIQPQTTNLRGSGGFREIRIPGVHITQPLRPPVLVAKALAGRDLRRSALTYLFERTTGDQPFLRNPQSGSPLLELQENRTDPEQQIDRVLFAPAARSYAVDAWVHPAVDASDSVLDRLAGWRGAETFDSSGRFENQPRYRASSAFDARAGSPWVGIWAPPSVPDPWISWRTPRPLTISRLRLTPAPLPILRPTVVRLSWKGGATPPLTVATNGNVELPRPVRARGFQMTIVAAQLPPRVTQRNPPSRAIGIGSLTVPGLRPIAMPTAGPLRAACGSVQIRVGGRQVPLQPRGTVAGLDAGLPLRARGCAGEARMGAAFQRVRSLPGAFSVDLLSLSSRAPVPLPPASGGGMVLDPGQLHNSSLNGVRVALAGPSWLVLGQSYSTGWRATCDGRSLGRPHPIDGYANGWLAPADCHRVAFSFAPQSLARAGYLISGVVCALLLAFLLAGRLLRRRRLAPVASHPVLPEDGTQGIALPRAVAIAAVVTVPLCLLFAVRTSVLIFPTVTLVLWRGAGPRLLTAVAAGLLGVVVPIAYALRAPPDHGGFNFEYSLDLIWAHWTGVTAIVLLMMACWRTLTAARRGRRPAVTPPTIDQPPPPEVEPEDPDLVLAGAADPARPS